MASNDSHILVDISNSDTRRILTSLDVIIDQGTYCSVGFSRNIIITNNIKKVESAVILLEESILHCGDSFEIIDVTSPSSNGKRLPTGQLTAMPLAGYEAIKKGILFMDIFIAISYFF
ncbi:uncharacterized protein BX664DRAFT_317793 [Halteromyces radiatus]|uniref:uncharacterized protein n=1 Tax=Halteromyces radiatus TaxID=101107 RepID=UPI0022205C1C|nr:uncharacterized protein BX664DRAFT_317793 [Halteromyces radiatus]KAI8079901.1 hypothetical protein BX664DRAFT_317793 [Halteromyces radiatus]